MHDRLTRKGVCSGSRDVFKFQERSDNILEMVEDTEIVTMEY